MCHSEYATMHNVEHTILTARFSSSLYFPYFSFINCSIFNLIELNILVYKLSVDFRKCNNIIERFLKYVCVQIPLKMAVNWLHIKELHSLEYCLSNDTDFILKEHIRNSLQTQNKIFGVLIMNFLLALKLKTWLFLTYHFLYFFPCIFFRANRFHVKEQ